ncbi:MAG: aminotransferase class I/II-fold pyridoxal phosphate-dependent enzyme, partial [Cyanobacteria bacterium J06641_5]
MTFPFLRPQLNELAAYTPHAAVTRTFDKLDTNESPYDLPAAFKEKLAALYEQDIHTNRYPDGSHAALKAEIAAYATESAGLATPWAVDSVSVGNGSDELIRSLLIATCIGGAGSILVAEPTFSMYGILAQTLGIPVVRVPRHLQDFSIDLDAANAAIAASQTETPVRVVFVVHPNSPTANPLTPTELDWLRGLPSDLLVAIDEAYFEFHRVSVVPELCDRPN